MSFGSSNLILVGEDEPQVRNYLDRALRSNGYQVAFARDGDETLACLDRHGKNISLVLLDILMPGRDGIETVRDIRRIDHDLPIIMISGAATPKRAAEAIKCGANDFLSKPIDQDELQRAIQTVLNADTTRVTPSAGLSKDDDALLHSLPQMQSHEAALRQIARSDVPVLLQGESGVGKEVLARKLHAHSPRASKLFLKLNCAALPSELLESELFGYDKGAFTGAFQSKPGKFQLAEGGTILLDEIGDMDFRLQAKLLQVLQDHEFHRLGGKETIRVDVRVLAATHRDLEAMIASGDFREDLYYRLNVINIRVPSLRERKEEILPLARFFWSKYATPGTTPPEIPPVLNKALLDHDWPGNIRELENVIRKFLVLQDADLIATELRLQTRRKRAAAAPLAAPLPLVTTLDGNGSRLQESALNQVDEAHRGAEKAAILGALQSAKWNRRRAAQNLGVEYKALLYRMKRLGLDVTDAI